MKWMSLISYNFPVRKPRALGCLFVEVDGPEFVLMTLFVLDQEFRIYVCACVGGGGRERPRREEKNKMR